MTIQRDNDDKDMMNREQGLLPWITPTFERMDLKDAMSGMVPGHSDSHSAYSGGIYSS